MLPTLPHLIILCPFLNKNIGIPLTFHPFEEEEREKKNTRMLKMKNVKLWISFEVKESFI